MWEGQQQMIHEEINRRLNSGELATILCAIAFNVHSSFLYCKSHHKFPSNWPSFVYKLCA
jgi:hypothetical protein